MIDAETRHKAVLVLGRLGRAPVVARRMSDATLAELAALLDEETQLLKPGGREAGRLILINHLESCKCVDADLDAPPTDGVDAPEL